MVHNIDNFSAKMGNISIAKNNKGVKAKGNGKRENMMYIKIEVMGLDVKVWSLILLL